MNFLLVCPTSSDILITYTPLGNACKLMLFVGFGYTEIANRFSTSEPAVAQSKPNEN